MDEKEHDEILYRLDERTKRVDEHLDRLDRRVSDNKEKLRKIDTRVQDNEDGISTINGALKTVVSVFTALFAGVGAKLAGLLAL